MTRSDPSPPARRAVTVTSKNGRTSRDALSCLTKFLHIFTPKPILTPLSSFPITILGTQSAFLFVLLRVPCPLSLTWSRLSSGRSGAPRLLPAFHSTLTQPREKGALFCAPPALFSSSASSSPVSSAVPRICFLASWGANGGRGGVHDYLSFPGNVGSGSGSQRGKCLCAPLENTSRREMR